VRLHVTLIRRMFVFTKTHKRRAFVPLNLMSTSSQARYWLLTIPQHEFTPFLPPHVVYLKGQTELGEETAFLHWQVMLLTGVTYILT